MLSWVVTFAESARLNHVCSLGCLDSICGLLIVLRSFSVSVLLLVPTMTFARVVVVLVHPSPACRTCLDFIEVFLVIFSLFEAATM